MSRPTLLGCLGLAAMLGALPLGAAQPYRYRRDVQVAQPGWVRVQVTLPVLTRLAASGEDCLLTDPSGAPLPVFPWVGAAEPAPMMLSVDLTDMRTVPSGWQVQADLGRDGIRHRMMLLDIPGTGLAEGVTLEASPDGKAWHLLARGSMFRLNRWGMTSKTYLEYPPTTDRYLRIFWPAKAGFPAWIESPRAFR